MYSYCGYYPEFQLLCQGKLADRRLIAAKKLYLCKSQLGEKEFLAVLESIGELDQCLLKHRKDYTDLHRMIEQEKDSIEHEIGSQQKIGVSCFTVTNVGDPNSVYEGIRASTEYQSKDVYLTAIPDCNRLIAY
ncbi:Syntaxin-81 protein [Spatholobus suberectus]|nr:Syntaxin-81 protein [Spatholobus suberectus]